MILVNRFSSLNKLLKEWGKEGKFYYYRKFLLESRKPFGEKQNKKYSTPLILFLKKVLSKFFLVFRFANLVFKILLSKKEQVIFFNHTVRKRKGLIESRPLYLPVQNFNYEGIIVFEDAQSDATYSQLNITSLLEISSVATKILNQLLELVLGFKDRDFVDLLIKLKLWELLLRALRPKQVNLLVWYGKESLIAACKKLDINVVDLQHGIIYEAHPIYNIKDGQEIDGSRFLLPNKCLVYGEYWKKCLLKSGWKSDEVEIVGYFLDTQKISENLYKQPYILYTSQPHSNRLIIEHIQSIKSEILARGWIAVIAVHPSENTEVYKSILSENVQLAKMDAYDSLRYCEAHISYSSTLLWESMLFNKSSYVLAFGTEAVDLLTDFIDYGFGKSLLNGQFPDPFTLPKLPNVDYFFQRVINTNLLYGEKV